MGRKHFNILLILSGLQAYCAFAQNKCEDPLPPILTSVSVQPETETIELKWTLSPSSDVAGYIVYSYETRLGNPGFFAIDTLKNPTATIYSFTTRIYRSFQFRIAALRLPDCKSELSNIVSTIFAETQADTCSNRINIVWNKYSNVPVNVSGYDILASVNSGTYSLAGHVSADVTSFTLNDFQNNSQYCFITKALLENGLVSSSNKSCINVKMQIPPAWINADYATVKADSSIELSFTVDPSSEIDTFAIERKTGYSGSFQKIGLVSGTDIKSATYTDKTAEKDKVNFYKISAVKCQSYILSSNNASNIVLKTENSGSEITLKWNKYHEWLGSVSSYRIFADKGNGYAQEAVTGQADTSFTINIPGIMYALTQGKVCFYVTAFESGNPHGISGEASSNRVCSEIEEVITVPNIFKPVGYKDAKNALFKPVLTFTPLEFRLVITSRQGKTLFETNDFLDSWDGSENGNPVPEGVYLWFLKIKTPAGKNISRTGTVTVVKN